MKIPMAELLSENEILSHVFFECAPKELLEKIADKNNELKNPEKGAVEIELIIAGEGVDVRKFFQLMVEQYDELVRKVATKIVKEQTADKLGEIVEKLNEMQEITAYWANDISWCIPENPFIKQTKPE